MLFQHKKSFLIALTSLVISGTSIGGSVNAEPLTSSPKEYRYPPADIPVQPKPRSAMAPVRQAPPIVQRPVAQRPIAPGYPMAYPAQRPFNPAVAPYGAPQNVPVPAPYGAPMNRAPVAVPPINRGPMGAAPMAGPRPMGPGPGVPPPYGNPYNRGPYNSGPYGGGPFGGNRPFGGNNMFDNFGFGPFNRHTAPWETWPFGSKDSFWSRKEMPFDEQNPTDWFDPSDPKEGLAIMWEDLISAPDDLGTMPGGWHVPSISVPNPVDLEDQMEKASKEVPDLIRIYH